MDKHIRSYAITDVGYDTPKRILEGRFVPYNEPARVGDMVDGRPDIYQEGFRPGSFVVQAGTAEPGNLRRIGLHHAHEGGLGFLGPVVRLEERDDGLWGHVSVLRSRSGDVEDLLAEGIDGLSIEFIERPGTTITESGVRWRTDARLLGVALEAKGAYAGARAMAFRSILEGMEFEEFEAADAEMGKRSAALEEWLVAETAKQAELQARYLPT